MYLRRGLISFTLYFISVFVLLFLQQMGGVTVRDSLLPLTEPVHHLYGRVLEMTDDLRDIWSRRQSLLMSINQLRNQNNHLKAELYKLKGTELENTLLRERLKLPDTSRWSGVIGGEVTGLNRTGWEQSLKINRGTVDGVQPGQIVVNIHADTWFLMGRVQSSSRHSSDVILTTDPRFKIGVTVEAVQGRQFVARGWGNNGLRIEHFPLFTDVYSHSRVYVAPASSVAPQNLLVGKVFKLERGDHYQRRGRRLVILPYRFESVPRILWIVNR